MDEQQHPGLSRVLERARVDHCGSRPLIIVVDGPNFAGKTTFVNRLRGHTARANTRVHGFPRGDTFFGKLARKTFADECETEATRAGYVAQDFVEALKEVATDTSQDLIIWDRFYLSTCACQGYAGWQALKQHRVFDYPVQPDVYVIVDVDYPEALRRATARREAQGIAWDQRIEDKELASEEAWDAARMRFMTYAQMAQRHMPNTKFLKVDQYDTVYEL